jgi:hypothetical protein
MHSYPIMVCAIILYTLITVSEATREDLIRGINRLNSDVIELRNEVEKAISGRCDSIRGCYKTNFDECQSNYTRQQTCPSFADIGYAVPECGTGKSAFVLLCMNSCKPHVLTEVTTSSLSETRTT